MFNAIAKSNGWDEEMAALQLFAHLEVNVIKVDLLIQEDKRATLAGLSQVVLDYYNKNKSRPQSQTQPSKQTKISIHIE